MLENEIDREDVVGVNPEGERAVSVELTGTRAANLRDQAFPVLGSTKSSVVDTGPYDVRHRFGVRLEKTCVKRSVEGGLFYGLHGCLGFCRRVLGETRGGECEAGGKEGAESDSQDCAS